MFFHQHSPPFFFWKGQGLGIKKTEEAVDDRIEAVTSLCV